MDRFGVRRLSNGNVSNSAEEDCEDFDDRSDVTSVLDDNKSIISNKPDHHGFFGGFQYCVEQKRVVPPELLIKRERKWMKMLNKWDTFMKKHYTKVKERCRKGIPPSVRVRAWSLLCSENDNKKMYPPNHFEMLCEAEGNPRYVEEIKKDLHRQFPYHVYFQSEEGYGQKNLFLVLKAYSVKNPTVGYCQAQAPIAAFLLLQMPPEDAFWCLVNISDRYLQEYFGQSMEMVQIDGDILFALLKKFSPDLHKHIKKQKIEPIMFMTEWFLCAYTRTLPWAALLRVWDMFLLEGVSILFKVGLILINMCLRNNSKSGSLKKRFSTMYDTLEALKQPPVDLINEDNLVKQICKIDITPKDLKEEHRRQVDKRTALAKQKVK